MRLELLVGGGAEDRESCGTSAVTASKSASSTDVTASHSITTLQRQPRLMSSPGRHMGWRTRS